MPPLRSKRKGKCCGCRKGPPGDLPWWTASQFGPAGEQCILGTRGGWRPGLDRFSRSHAPVFQPPDRHPGAPGPIGAPEHISQPGPCRLLLLQQAGERIHFQHVGTKGPGCEGNGSSPDPFPGTRSVYFQIGAGGNPALRGEPVNGVRAFYFLRKSPFREPR
jgi:hypothetical protein